MMIWQYSAFHPIAVLLNLVLSMAVKWQLRSELALRESGLDYTILRPGGLNNLSPNPGQLVSGRGAGAGGGGGGGR
jgi:uncharacterized protein YbjT (DUF2867 family)